MGRRLWSARRTGRSRAAYVFVKHGGKWSEQQEIDSPAGAAQDTYGLAVSLSGDGQTALVGAPTGNGGNGIVYSYRRQGGKYVLDGQITAPDGAYGDEFGEAGLAVGARQRRADRGDLSTTATRAPHTCSFAPRKSWSEQREYQDPVAPGEAYGYSVSEAADGLSGVVGAPFRQRSAGRRLRLLGAGLLSADARRRSRRTAFLVRLVRVDGRSRQPRARSAARAPIWVTARRSCSTHGLERLDRLPGARRGEPERRRPVRLLGRARLPR